MDRQEKITELKSRGVNITFNENGTKDYLFFKDKQLDCNIDFVVSITKEELESPVKWSVGTYTVRKNDKFSNIGHIHKIGISNAFIDVDEEYLKWFATKEEAEVFSESLKPTESALDKWSVLRTSENYKVINEWALKQNNVVGEFIDNIGYVNFNNNIVTKNIYAEYRIITYEYFKEYILKQSKESIENVLMKDSGSKKIISYSSTYDHKSNPVESELDKWLRETKAKNFDWDKLYQHIFNMETTKSSVYNLLEGKYVSDKTNILYNQWNHVASKEQYLKNKHMKNYLKHLLNKKLTIGWLIFINVFCGSSLYYLITNKQEVLKDNPYLVYPVLLIFVSVVFVVANYQPYKEYKDGL